MKKPSNSNGVILKKTSGVNTDLAIWEKQFKCAIKKGARPEGDLFEALVNNFDAEEW